MRFSAAALLLCLGAAVALVSAQDDFDYGEDAEAALDEKPEVKPLPPVARRPALPTARKSPLSRSRTPVTPPPPPPSPPPQQEEPESEDAEFAEEGDEAPVTEASTKKPLIRGGVRPFRSNQDLLEALKRRRQNIRVSTQAPEDRDEESASQAPSSTSSRRRFNNGRATSKAPAASPEVEESSKAASRPSSRNGRRFSGRGRVVEEEEQPAVVEEPKSRTGRRRF